MKYIVLTVLVCIDVAVFSALYLRATEISHARHCGRLVRDIRGY